MLGDQLMHWKTRTCTGINDQLRRFENSKAKRCMDSYWDTDTRMEAYATFEDHEKAASMLDVLPPGIEKESVAMHHHGWDGCNEVGSRAQML